MRESKTKKIGQLISDFFDKNQSTNHVPRVNALQLWKKLMGTSVVSETKSISFKENMLYIKINNPYLRKDLIYQQNHILKKIQVLEPSIHNIFFS